MITRNLISLPNHPALSNVTRKAVITQAIRNDKANYIYLDLEIFHYINGVEQTYFPKPVRLQGDNNSRVDITTGEEVLPDAETGEWPEGCIGEYDYLWSIVNVAKLYTQVELEELYILKRVETINKKLYN